MVALNKYDYKRVSSIFESVTNSRPVIFSVIDGNVDGRIYVDDLEYPKTALLVIYDTFFLIGEANQESCNKIYDLLINEVFPSMSEEYYDFFCLTDKLREMMEKLFSAQIQGRPIRKTFIFNKTSFDAFIRRKDFSLPDGYEIKLMNQEFIDTYHCDKDFWNPSTKRFGVALVNEAGIVSECTAVFVGGGQAEISIETKEEYRNKGYATIVSAVFIQHCLSIGLLPNWGCWDFRTASIALAKRLGFVENPDCIVLGLKR